MKVHYNMFAFFSDGLIERLGWVLLHSIWEFAMIALIAGGSTTYIAAHSLVNAQEMTFADLDGLPTQDLGDIVAKPVVDRP